MDMDVEIEERHRQEKKDLKAKTTKMKNSVPPSDKKRRKEINAEIERLEQEMKLRHEKELQEQDINSLVKDKLTLNEETSDLQNRTVANQHEEEEEEPTFKYQVRQVSKAQLKKDKKRQAQKQRQEEAESEDVSHLRLLKDQEVLSMARLLESRGLKIHEIASDGDCLYKSIEHQLSLFDTQTTVNQLRKMTADFMRSHPDDFMPFIDSGDDLEKEFDKYCMAIEKTSCWGGHLELQALSKALDVFIEVLQANGPLFTFGDNDRKKLLLSYHRHAYSLGEHYNSLVIKS